MSKTLKSWLIQISLAIGLFLWVFFTRLQWNWRAANDGFFVVSAVFLSWMSLKWVGDEGTFDVLSFSMIKLLDSFKKVGTRSFKDPYEYQQFKAPQRVKSRKTYGSYLWIGLISALLTLVTFFLS